MAKLYQYCVYLEPTPEEAEKGRRTELVVPPSEWIMADSPQEVVMIAGRAIPEEVMKHADRLEVAVRPF